MNQKKTDILIIAVGLAGITAAITAAKKTCKPTGEKTMRAPSTSSEPPVSADDCARSQESDPG